VCVCVCVCFRAESLFEVNLLPVHLSSSKLAAGWATLPRWVKGTHSNSIAALHSLPKESTLDKPGLDRYCPDHPRMKFHHCFLESDTEQLRQLYLGSNRSKRSQVPSTGGSAHHQRSQTGNAAPLQPAPFAIYLRTGSPQGNCRRSPDLSYTPASRRSSETALG
jgi:hypothetical protein